MDLLLRFSTAAQTSSRRDRLRFELFVVTSLEDIQKVPPNQQSVCPKPDTFHEVTKLAVIRDLGH